ncbi:MAG: hypothetical protein Q8O26_04805 [Phreatobacter sp.]|uniref:hypothetical protein n=1 Tax=Phreatobacter sp. TaxID=1966341 RepID=UPI002734C7D1|nr:hypothetical protein [Phreatobacter sp.]MDP2801186.1 hypothetical protein [Phreatobacter sp.]
MKAEDDDVIDFKPFFDLVVGVIFILLILIAAQMFFAQQQGDTAQSRSEQAEELARRAEAMRFLDDLARELSRNGFEADVDRLGLAVVLPARTLVAGNSGPSCARPTVDREAAARFGRALAGKLACVGTGAVHRESCPAFALRGSANMIAELQTPTLGADATPGPVQRAMALDLAAAIFSAEPDLLALRTADRGLLIDPAFGVRAVPDAAARGGEACGQLRLGFPLLARPPAP